MALSRRQKSTLAKIFAAAGAAPLAIGAGTVFSSGLTGAFNVMGAMNGLPGGLVIGAGAVLGGAAAVIAAFNAFDKGYFGKTDVAAGVLFLAVGCPALGLTGGFLGATGSSAIASFSVPHITDQQVKAPVFKEIRP